MIVPDLWQQRATVALREGRDVVVDAPTGAGKTLIFESWANDGRPKGRAVYTVPTRALANDKMAEWRARGWDVGIATGDVSAHLDAPIIVATLETQKRALLEGRGPDLLVVDEYQMLGDDVRGLNYEIALALCPPTTRLALFSGSVANPGEVAAWLERLGRSVELVRTQNRPTPLEEANPFIRGPYLPSSVRGYWPELIASALAEDLGPTLIFAPRRKAAEKLARELAEKLPNPHPLSLTPEQKALVGPKVVALLERRIAFHHSGLSYQARAGVIEPLAKAGQLRVVVATMGLAAGINFSLRSVAVAGTSYFRGAVETPIREDELLQMFGRAGRRGIDEIGYVIVSNNRLRIRDAAPRWLKRTDQVDWSALLGIMAAASDAGRPPYLAAVEAQKRLFAARPVVLGVEGCMARPVAPCGLSTDTERSRFCRKRCRQFLNSAGEWEDSREKRPAPIEEILVADPIPDSIFALWRAKGRGAETEEPPQESLRWRPGLSEPSIVEAIGKGEVVALPSSEGPEYGLRVKMGEIKGDDGLSLARWVKRDLALDSRSISLSAWDQDLRAKVQRVMAEQGLETVEERRDEGGLWFLLCVRRAQAPSVIDGHGRPLWRPPHRDVPPAACRGCDQLQACREMTPEDGAAALWGRLGLVETDGAPTRRGRIVSFYSKTIGLAVAAALEDRKYELEDLVFDLADLDAGERFDEDGQYGVGRLAAACIQVYGRTYAAGYLENGAPLGYGAGASEVARAVHFSEAGKAQFVTPTLGIGDIDRMLIEWRSVLRQTLNAPELEWDRWTEFRKTVASILDEMPETRWPTPPPLEYHQKRRISHQLRF